MHQPLQIFRPDWNSYFYSNAKQVRSVRNYLMFYT